MSALITNLYPRFQVKVNQFLSTFKDIYKMELRVTQGLRTFEEQNALFSIGRTTQLDRKPVTNAKGGMSWHNFSLAFDVCFKGNDPYPKDDNLWKNAADLGKNIGLEPGYYFKRFQDKPHFQCTYGLQLFEANEIYQRGGLELLFKTLDELTKFK